MGYKSKDDFYLEIEDDYKENRTESFIFKFIKKKKDLQIEAGKLSPKRNSRYMLLQSLYKEYKKSGKSGAELTGFLTDSLRELSLDELKEIMPGHGDKTTKKVLLVDAGKKIRSEFGSKKLPENGAVIRLVELLGSKYLDADIKNFFYEIGLNKNKSGGRRKTKVLICCSDFWIIKASGQKILKKEVQRFRPNKDLRMNRSSESAPNCLICLMIWKLKT